jgi:hypothetical protein
MTNTFTTTELIACAMRELRMRQRVYPGLVERGRMSRATADKEQAMMLEIVNRLRASEDA